MKHPILFALLLTCLLFTGACNNDDGPCGDPISQYIQLTLVDPNNIPLIGSVYDPDSIKLTVNGTRIDTQTSAGAVRFYYPSLQPYNNAKYLLYLSSTDTDTLTFVVNQQTSEACGSYYEITSFTYNTVPVTPTGYVNFTVVKNP
jgi:hypothetical protein